MGNKNSSSAGKEVEPKLKKSQLMIIAVEYIYDGDLEGFKSLEKKLDSDIILSKDGFGRSPLHIVSMYGYLNFVEYIIERLKDRPQKIEEIINKEDVQGDTPLTLLCTFGTALDNVNENREIRQQFLENRMKILELLISKGAQLDCNPKEGKNSLLHWAIFHADRKLAEMIFDECPFAALKQNRDGLVPFEIAFQNQYSHKYIKEEALRIVCDLCSKYIEQMSDKESFKLLRAATPKEKEASRKNRKPIKQVQEPQEQLGIFDAFNQSSSEIGLSDSERVLLKEAEILKEEETLGGDTFSEPLPSPQIIPDDNEQLNTIEDLPKEKIENESRTKPLDETPKSLESEPLENPDKLSSPKVENIKKNNKIETENNGPVSDLEEALNIRFPLGKTYEIRSRRKRFLGISLNDSKELQLLYKLFGISCYCGDSDLTFRFIELFKFSPFRRSVGDYSALSHAILARDTLLATRILSSDYKESSKNGRFILEDEINRPGKLGNTPLHLACLTQNMQICQLLMNFSASNEIFNDLALRPFEMANFSITFAINNFVLRNLTQLVPEYLDNYSLPPIRGFSLLIVGLGVSSDPNYCLALNQLRKVKNLQVEVIIPPVKTKGELYRFFLVCQASENVFAQWASQQSLPIFNYKKRFFEQFSASRMSEFEQLRDYHKQRILLRQINFEFKLNEYLDNGLVEEILPNQDKSRALLIYEIWTQQWLEILLRPFKTVQSISDSKLLNVIAFYYGCDQAFIFEFVNLFTGFMGLAGILSIAYSIFMIVQWEIDSRVIPFNFLFVSLIALVFLKRWARRQEELAFAWNTRKYQYREMQLESYYGRYEINVELNTISKVYWRWSHLLELLIDLLVFLLATGLIVGTFILYKWLNSLVGESSGNIWLHFLVGAANGLSNAVIGFVYLRICLYLAPYENLKYEKNNQNSLVFKLCVFRFVLSFINLFYYLFYLQDLKIFSTNCASIVIMNDISFAFSKYCQPLIISYYKQRGLTKIVNDYRSSITNDLLLNKNWMEKPLLSLTNEERETLSKFALHRHTAIQGEVDLTRPFAADLTKSWVHKFIQFSFLCFLGPIFPPIMFWIFLFNFVEISLDVYFLSHRTVRHICREEKDIGNWNRIFILIIIGSVGINGLTMIKASKGLFWLLFLDPQLSQDKHTALIVVAITCSLILLLIITVMFFISNRVSWIKDQVFLQKELKQKNFESLASQALDSN